MPIENLLIPILKFEPQNGFFRWPKEWVLASCHRSDEMALSQLTKILKQKHSKTTIHWNAYGSATLRLLREHRFTKESYQLSIERNKITIISGDDAGCYYAIQTLIDLIKIGRLRCGTIKDKPQFHRRGISLDCSRGKVPKLTTLKNLVERLAHWKVNELQLYIENVFQFKQHPNIGRGTHPFSPTDILELQQHCQKHHIRLVGSLASLGHMEKILSIKEYQPLAELPGFRGHPGGTTLCPTDPKSIQFISSLYEEYIPLFDADDFNVCCDEPWELGQGRSKAKANKLGAGQIYLDYLLKLHRLCESYGKRMNLWADIVLKYPQIIKKLPRDIVLLNWEYEANGPRIQETKQLAEKNLNFMVCPGTSSWQTHGTRLGNAMDNVRHFAKTGKQFGSKGVLNTDWGDNGHRNLLGLSMHGFAHGAAHSWQPGKVNEPTFTRRYCQQTFGKDYRKVYNSLKLMGSTYSQNGAPWFNENGLYFSLVEPLMKTRENIKSRMDLLDSKKCQLLLKKFDALNLSIESKPLASFDKQTLKDILCGVAMERLALKRTIIGKSLRQLGTVDKTECRQLKKEYRSMAKQFEKAWLNRNRPSRLKDNLNLFKRSDKELEKILKKL